MLRFAFAILAQFYPSMDDTNFKVPISVGTFSFPRISAAQVGCSTQGEKRLQIHKEPNPFC